MLEMLVAGGGRPAYPNSGPGPKILQAGTSQLGYYGTLTPAELFTPTEMFNNVGIQATAPNADSSLLWCKFSYQGSTVYIPTQPMHYYPQMLSWEDLYQAGIVYGTDDNGSFPSPVGSPVNQRTVIAKTLESKPAGFVVRLPAAGSTDPNSPAVAESSMAGEIAELLTKVIAQGVGFGTGKWDSISSGIFATSSYHLMKTSQSGATTNTLVGIGTTSKPGSVGYTGVGKTAKAANYGWWPVLEYVNPDLHVLGVTDVSASLPPPLAVDLSAPMGESTGGIVNVTDVRCVVGASFSASAETDLLKSQVNQLTVANTSAVPVIRSAVVEPVSGVINPYVTLMAEQPRVTVS